MHVTEGTFFSTSSHTCKDGQSVSQSVSQYDHHPGPDLLGGQFASLHLLTDVFLYSCSLLAVLVDHLGEVGRVNMISRSVKMTKMISRSVRVKMISRSVRVKMISRSVKMTKMMCVLLMPTSTQP